MNEDLPSQTRQDRREKKRRKKKDRQPQHGKSLGRIYADAVTKRAKPR